MHPEVTNSHSLTAITTRTTPAFLLLASVAQTQLAALLCIDDRYLKAEGVPFEALKGCVPVDGDTYDIPAMIVTAELRATVHGLPLPKFGNKPPGD